LLASINSGHEPERRKTMSNTDTQTSDLEKAKQTAALQFLKDDYKWRLDYLSAHLGRMWQRFNFFIVLEAGLSAALWVWLKEALSDQAKVILTAASGIAWIGFATSLVWYMFGAQDRRLFAVYQEKVKEVAKVLDTNLGLGSMLNTQYTYVGDQRIKLTQKLYEYLYQWRAEPISTTKLAAWFPLLATVYWIYMLIWIPSLSR
jgi:hypothetical protein